MNIDNQLVKDLTNIINSKENFLDFNGINMDYSTHKYHGYPATMIPKLPEFFFNSVTKYKKITNLYDPFMGSGTTLVEGLRHNINSTGVDLNPLATLISRVKTKKLDSNKLKKQYLKIQNEFASMKLKINMGETSIKTPDFKNIDYWFKPYVIQELQIIRNSIMDIKDTPYREFFLVAFSSTVRYVSNTRNGEFKMYRMSPKMLEKWNPNVFDKFAEVVNKNIEANSKLQPFSAKANVILGSSSKTDLPDNSFDMLITSPPYGDSKTTVAYGQFSRTSLQWLDLDTLPADKVSRLDKELLGGTITNKKLSSTKSPLLNHYINLISEQNEKRALEVVQFYNDLFEVLKECYRVMKPNSYQFWVTANRTVKGIQLPTDQIITELYASLGVKKIAHFSRNIPNKRMPSKNSPTNIKGKKISTMKKENIVIYKTIK